MKRYFQVYLHFINMPIFQKKAFKKPGWQHWVIFFNKKTIFGY